MIRFRSACKNQLAGMTLLEILVALFLFAIMVSGASVFLMKTSARYRLQRAVWEICSQMNRARYRAVFQGTRYRIHLDEGGYSIEEYDVQGKRWRTKKAALLSGVLIQANNSPVFHPQGTVSNLATIKVSNAVGSYRITLAISGRIKVVKSEGPRF